MSDDSSKKPEHSDSATSATLDPDEITVDREVARRSVLTAIGASVLGAVATACGPRIPRARYYGARPVGGMNDNDPQDPAGGGRGGVYVQQGQPQQVYEQQPGPVYVQPQPQTTGVTDRDTGSYADPAGRGRGGQPLRTGLTDGDSGAYADPGGGGRGTYRSGFQGSVTDGDSGQWSDPAGHGRGRSGLTDNDSGPYADPAGRGRGGVRGGGSGTGVTDSDSPEAKTYYFDFDNDGYGSAASGKYCSANGFYRVLVSGDCNDNDPNDAPGRGIRGGGGGRTDNDPNDGPGRG
ncbi:MAG: hypothetical protein WCJ30_08010, partial [Deltaproteobacteria bacterium]